MIRTFRPVAALALAASFAGAAGSVYATTTKPSTIGLSGRTQLEAEIKTLSLQLAETAKSAGVTNPKMDDKALKAHIEGTLLGVLSRSGTDISVGAEALRLSLADRQLTGIEVEAIRELLQKLARAAGIEPAALGTGVDLIPPPPGGIAGGGYRTE